MTTRRVGFVLVVATAVGLAAAASAIAQTRDHLLCYRVRDPLALRAVADIQTRFGIDPACKVGKARLYCEPTVKTVLSTNHPIVPMEGRGLLDSRICYRLTCPNAALAGFGGTTDQFGNHDGGRAKGKLLCVPAVHGPPMAPMDNLDDIKCYKQGDKSFGRLQATVNAETLHLGMAVGCQVTKTRYFCTGAHTTLQSVNVDPLLPISGTTLDDDRVCYAVKCPQPYPPPQIVSDRFGSRTDVGLVPRVICTPAPLNTATTITTTSTTVTTTTFPPGTDPVVACQRIIEMDGMNYAAAWIDRLEACAEPGGPTVAGCSATSPVGNAITQWRADATSACAGVDLRGQLGYGNLCGSYLGCQSFTGNTPTNLVDCLGCSIQQNLVQAANNLYAARDPSGSCATTLGDGALGLLRTNLQQLGACAQAPGATSIAACYTFDATAWRTQAESACTGVDPYGSLGYTPSCNRQGIYPVFPGACAMNAIPCTMFQTQLTTAGPDNDLLDCVTCQTGEGILGVARDLFGANLCCIGGTCNQVLTRVACYEAGGTPVRYGISSLPGVSTGGAHGIDVGPDGNLYMTGPGNVVTRVALPGGAQTTVGTTPSFPTGVAIDTAGNVYVTNRCQHVVSKIPPGGPTVTFAGTGTSGHSGDGGLATAAMISGPDGIAVDAAGNVYFTESGTLSIGCGAGNTGTERVRMVDTAGMIHTIAGGGNGPEGGPALGALLGMPYGLRLAGDGTLIIGEAGSQRALRIDAGGMLVRIAGESIGLSGVHAGYGGPAVRAHFYQNCGVGEDPDGNVLIGPMEDNRIALVDTLGSVIGIAGTGQGSTSGQPSGDGGTALLGQAGCPEDTVAGPDGKVYFTDLWTQRIRVLTRESF